MEFPRNSDLCYEQSENNFSFHTDTEFLYQMAAEHNTKKFTDKQHNFSREPNKENPHLLEILLKKISYISLTNNFASIENTI